MNLQPKKYLMKGFCCPLCKDGLELIDGERYFCKSCSRSFPIFYGLPDFRVFDPPYATREQDLSEARTLLTRYNDLNYEELVRFKFSFYRQIPPDLCNLYIKYRLNQVERGRARLQKIEELLNLFDGSIANVETALDLGCGTGWVLVAMSNEIPRVAGADISMAELILAKKLLEEHGSKNITFVCCCSENLPFRGEFDLINANDVIEHLRFQGKALSEGYNALSKKGFFCFSSPNRFDIFGPEPHVKVRWLGFLPRKFQEPYVRLIKKMEYKGKRLLSLPELRRLLRANIPGNNHYLITYPPPIDASKPGKTTKGRIIRKLPLAASIINNVPKTFMPHYEIIIKKR